MKTNINGNDTNANGNTSKGLLGAIFLFLFVLSIIFFVKGLVSGKYEDLEGCIQYYFNSSEVISQSSAEHVSYTESSKEPSAESSAEPSAESSVEPSEESSAESSEESSVEPSEESSAESSEELSKEPSEESSAEPSEESSAESSEESSAEPSEESSAEPSEESSAESSEEPSKEPSEESFEESSEEVSENSTPIYEEIKSEFSQHTVAYALYDIVSGKLVTEYNTTESYRTGCTIKPAVVLYLLSERNITKEWTNTTIQILSDDEDGEGRSVIRNEIRRGNLKWGQSLSVKYLVYLTVVFSDNIGYQMLCRHYFPGDNFKEFNDYMKSIGANIKLGYDEIPGTVYTEATVADQMAVWKAINDYIDSKKPGASTFKKHLMDTDGYKYVEKALNTTTASMAGWVNGSTTFNECYIVPGKYIAVVLTRTGERTPADENIDTKPLKKIAVKLHQAWEAYNS